MRVKAEPVIDAAADLGKTRCRVSVRDGATELTGAAEGAPGLAAEDGPALALAALLTACPQVTPARWAVGAAGAVAAPGAAGDLAEQLCVQADLAVVTSDAVTAHLGALAGEPGVVVVAGTGAVAIGVDGDGDLALGDGAGPERGDRGSGGWLGRRALQVARSQEGPLREAAAARFGAETDAVATATSASAAARRAAFVPDVLDCAKAGDPDAVALIDEAAAELAATATDVLDRLAWHRPPEVVLVGGLLALGDLLTGPLKRRIDRALAPARGDALTGARVLLDRDHLPHERWVHRRSAS